ncbi:hypothetical protein AKJ39_05095 [candidate division MSBL1 archaeon SCGC-AAA259J03]|uniref:Uncharacterized protein n=1 Tax=candidate division MSBL1 archaeon SCGC-AAA259J03 TaxID=1698269 RepID=A0A656YV92_9EURY|nr:hypothetical protein AKJ39_05095 [candidate division MSBL1 archaeon SCGC-AAA259J03]
MVSFFTLVDAFQETESHKYGPQSNESYPNFFFREQVEYLAKGKCLGPEEFPGELENEIREHMDKINEMMKEFEEKFGMERVRVKEEFILSSPAGEIQYEEGDIIRVPKELAEERDELVPFLRTC